MACKKSEVAVYVVFLPFFFTLLCGPVGIYLHYSHQQIPSPEGSSFNNSNPPNSSRCYQSPYSGICLGPLQSCISQESSVVQISSSVDVAANEQLAMRIITLLGVSPCLASAHGFLCQFLFPLCDINGTLYEPTMGECLNISLGVCKEQWQLAAVAGLPLPVCSELPNTTSVCNGNSSAVSFQPALTCSEDYYFNGSVCLAQCGQWVQFPRPVARSVVGTELFAALFGCISEVALIAMFIHQRSRVTKFPSVFMIYHTVCYFIIAIFVFINHAVPFSDLFCSEKSVIDTVAAKPTAFCNISGIVLQYFFPSMCWWWLFHIFGVFWKFVFPLHAKRHASRERLLYGVLVVCGVGLPLPGVIATLATEGYAIGRYPPLLCTSKDPDVFYYSVVFLTSVIIAAGLFMLVVLYWTLYKHKRFLQISSHGAAAEENRRHTLLLAVLTYYLIFGTMAIIQQSLELGQSHSLQAAVGEVFRCEALGVTSNCTVDYQQYSYPKLSSVVYVMMGLIPAVHMIFVLPARQLWRRVWLYCTRERGGDDKEKGGDDMGALIQRQLSGSKSSSDPV